MAAQNLGDWDGRLGGRQITQDELVLCEWALWQPNFEETEPDLLRPTRMEVRIVDPKPRPGMVTIRGFKLEEATGYAHLNVDEKILTVPVSEIYYAERKKNDRRSHPFPHHCNYHGLELEPTNRRGMKGKLGTFYECTYPGCDVGKWSTATDSSPADGETRNARRLLFELLREKVAQARFSSEGQSVVSTIHTKGGIGRLNLEECRTFMERLDPPPVPVAQPAQSVFLLPTSFDQNQVVGRARRPHITMEPQVQSHRCANCGRHDVALSRSTGWCANCEDIHSRTKNGRTKAKPKKPAAPPRLQSIRDIEID